MPSPKVIQLRQLLSEKFPGLRLRLAENSINTTDCTSKGSLQIEELLQSGWAQGALNEIVAAGKCSGSATLIRAIVHSAAARHQIIGLVDAGDSLDVTQLETAALAQLLWVRCSAADQALKAADLLLRDGNLPLVLLDFKLNPETQLRKIPATTWYRFQRLVEATATVCLVFTPRPMVAPAKTRMTLQANFSLADLPRAAGELLEELKLESAEAPHFHEAGQNFA